MAHPCPVCQTNFTEKRNLTRHLKNQHGNLWACQQCQQSFNRYDNYCMHQRVCNFKTSGKRSFEDGAADSPTKKLKDNVIYAGGALENTLVDYRLDIADEEQDANNVLDVLKESVHQLKNKINDELTKKKALKFYVALHANFHLSHDESFTTSPPAVLRSEAIELYKSSNINEVLDKTYESLIAAIENYVNRGSGWVLDRLVKLDLHILEFNPLRGTSYIPLPKDLQHNRGIINIKNKDEKCFLWSTIAGLHGDPNDHDPNRVSHYKKFENRFDIQGISFPTPLKDIPKFERQNNVSISVYGYENGKENKDGFVYPLKVSKEVKERHVDLLLIGEDNNNHYCYVKDFGKLVGSQYSSTSNKKYFCRFCMHGFSRSYTSQDLAQHRRTDEEMKKKLKDHEENCFSFAAQRTEFPEETNVKFKNVKNQVQAPFLAYADFESILKNLSEPNKSQEHIPCSYAYKIVSNIPGIEFDLHEPYVGSDAVDKFLDNLQNDLNKHIIPIIEKDVPMIWDDDAQQRYDNATHCHICEKELDRSNETPARDHCHFTGRFRGAAHNQCNLDYKIDKDNYKLPVVFHNLRGYDAHMIFQKIHRRHGKITVIPNNSERYISFTVGRLKFLDSMQFLSGSLEDLAAQLNEDQFHNLAKVYSNEKQQRLLRQKGVYCYDYMNSMEKFDEACLPDQTMFHNSLTGKDITDGQYIHAKVVWKTLQCTTMKDYHNHYLKTDILLLADVFENFRKMVMSKFQLDPIHYYSLPGLSWDAMLKYTGVEMDLITDIDMYHMVEKGMRGGICNISHRYATANHPNMDTYNEKEEVRTLTLQDANALYAWAMSQLLPLRNFKWINPDDIDILKIPMNSRLGYILEVDLEYCKELHDAHNLYPLAPEHLEVSNSMLSPFQKVNFPSIRGTVKKLVPNLLDKKKYVIHYQNLQLYVSLGMKIKKIHRVIQFEQSAWMKPYIDLNIELRKEATIKGDKVGKDLFKLFNNAVFGKTMENLRKRIDFEVVTSRKIALKRIAKPNFKHAKRFREDLVGIHTTKPVLKLNRPIQVGFAVLDLSKYLMYNFHYNTWMKKFPNSKLLFTDTDSLAYEIIGHDMYAGMAEINNEFDFSEYPQDHPLFSRENMKTVGKFKDECFGQLMLNFVGLRPKLYSFDYERLAFFDVDENGVEREVKKQTATSVTRIIVDNKNANKGIAKTEAKKLSFNDYERTLRTLKSKKVDIKRIGSDHHNVFTYKTNKIGLSAFDTKRWICEDGIHTFAFGHWRTYTL